MNRFYSSSPSGSALARRRVFLLLLLFAFCLALSSGCTRTGSRAISVSEKLDASQRLHASIVDTARSNIGVRYKRGGTAPDTGFDCSGFVLWTYRQCGITLPRTTREQMKVGKEVKKDQLRPGDVVAFKISNRRGYHTGIYSGNGKFIHSPSTGKSVKEDSMNSSYWKNKFITARRVANSGQSGT